MTPLEPQKKVLISEDFLDTDHGEIECEVCHGGDPEAENKLAAHKDFDPTPSVNDPESACGDCHEEIVETAKGSLHATLSTFSTILKRRSKIEKWPDVAKGRERHCADCHTSCGGCHVSRPSYVGKGFVEGHNFNSRPDPINQCTACHGSRIGNEYYGMRGQGDVHLVKYNMTCVSCHTEEEMHAAAPKGLKDRYHLEESIACADCHEDLRYGSVRDHEIHIDKVQCQVCHSQTYTNCYSCHTGTDPQGLPYFVNKKDTETMKIGLNTDAKAPGANYRYMLVRHVPVDPEVFAHYTENAFENFSSLPTWKRTSPHNIQRKTWQNANCNNCHGNRELFLSTGDLLDYEIEANRHVVVSDKRLPKPIARTRPLNLGTESVRSEMVMDVRRAQGEARRAGTDRHRRPQRRRLRKRAYPRRNPAGPARGGKRAALALEIGKAHAAGKRRKLSCDLRRLRNRRGRRLGGLRRGRTERRLPAVRSRLRGRCPNIAFLDGGIGSWKDAGYPVTNTPNTLPAKAFEADARADFIADNEFVMNNLDNPEVAVVDVRILQQAKGMAKHPRAARAGQSPRFGQAPGLLPVHGPRPPEVARGTAPGIEIPANHPRQEGDCHLQHGHVGRSFVFHFPLPGLSGRAGARRIVGGMVRRVRGRPAIRRRIRRDETMRTLIYAIAVIDRFFAVFHGRGRRNMECDIRSPEDHNFGTAG